MSLGETFFLAGYFGVLDLAWLAVSPAEVIVLRAGCFSSGFGRFLATDSFARGTSIFNALLRSISCSCSWTIIARKVWLKAYSPIAPGPATSGHRCYLNLFPS